MSFMLPGNGDRAVNQTNQVPVLSERDNKQINVSAQKAGTGVTVVQSLSGVRLCSPMDCSMPGFPVLHYLSEFA